jgi:hypothetical protein
MKYAIIQNNLVVNIAEAEPDFAAQMGWITYPEYVENKTVGIGWQFDGSSWTEPVVIETTEITEPTDSQQA